MNNATIAGFIPGIYVPHVIILTAVFVLSVFMIIIGIATCKLRHALHAANIMVQEPTNTTHRANYGSISRE
jgi:hypothetical protein